MFLWTFKRQCKWKEYSQALKVYALNNPCGHLEIATIVEDNLSYFNQYQSIFSFSFGAYYIEKLT